MSPIGVIRVGSSIRRLRESSRAATPPAATSSHGLRSMPITASYWSGA